MSGVARTIWFGYGDKLNNYDLKFKAQLVSGWRPHGYCMKTSLAYFDILAHKNGKFIFLVPEILQVLFKTT